MPYIAPEPPRTLAWGNTNTTTPDMVVPSYWNGGFPAPTGGIPVKPPRGYINYLFNLFTAALRYYLQRGIPNWSNTEDGYLAGAVVRSSNGLVYQLFGTATAGTAPESDATNWVSFNRRDVNGLVVGQYDEWTETWAGFGKYTNSLGVGATSYSERWQYSFTGSDTNASIAPVAFGIPTTSLGSSIDPGQWPAMAHRGGVQLTTGRNINDYVQVVDAYPMAVLDDNVVLALETSASVFSISDSYWLFGFSDKQNVNAITDGAFFIAQTGSANWQARTIAAGVQTNQDTGIAVSTGAGGISARFRIVARGANMGLGARQIQFFINDTFVCASNANLPFNDVSGGTGPRGAVRAIIGGQHTATSIGNPTAVFGPMRYAQRYKAI